MSILKRTLVIGGGIGGLTLGAALAQRGLAADIVEIDAQHSPLGVGIIQPGNALRALSTIGVMEQCYAAGFPMDERRYHDTEGTLLVASKQTKVVDPTLPATNALPRPALHRILIAAAKQSGADIRMATSVTRIAETPEGIEAEFSDGRSGRYDAAVGADGIRSSLRRQLFGWGHEPRYVGYGCWRVTLPRPDDVTFSGLYQGPDGTKAGLVPLTPETMYLFLVTREPDKPHMSPERMAELLRERLQGYRGTIGEIRDGLSGRSEIFYSALEEVILPPPWHQGRMLLIGDAAHASLPHIAQGAAMAIEDAVVFAELAAQDLPVEARMNTFMQRRYARCKYVQDVSHSLADDEIAYTPETLRAHQEQMRAAYPGIWRKNELRLAEPI